MLSLLAVFFSTLPTLLHAQEEAEQEILTTAAQIRALSPEEAAKQLPIRLRGCFIQRENNSFSMQDDTDGIFVFTTIGFPLDFERGDLIEVEGITNAGDYAPCATARVVRRIGKTVTPTPIPATIVDLHDGQRDANWVEVVGIVRSIEVSPIPENEGSPPTTKPEDKLHTQIKLEDGGAQLMVELQDVLEPSLYLDAKVRIRGHCYYLHNGNRQFVRPILHTPTGIKPEILEPPLQNSFNGPPKPVSSLFTFDHTGGNPGHRVHVRGVVTHQRPGNTFWIRDETHSLRVHSSQDELLKPGDIVDVLGFPEPGTYSPVFHDAEFRKRGSDTPPSPVTLDGIRMSTRHDSDLVRLEATLLEIQRYPESIELTLKSLGTTIRASLLTGAKQVSLPSWRPGSIVEVSGIATVGEGETKPLNGLWWAESLHILLRSSDDLSIITPAPWWTPKRISYALATVLVLAIGTIALIVLLSRHRLREQKHQRAMAESEFSAILSERNRLAREIHDTLAQNIGAISVQLELVRPGARNLNEATQKHIQTAHKLARTALADARDSIWNMRSQVLEQYDLGGALERITTQLIANTGIQSSFDIKGARRRLPPIVENNMLRIGQEAVTNACKHAQPNNITVQVTYHQRRVELVVTDDGIGFEAEHLPPETNRRFGLVGIRERVELLGGEIEIKSAKNEGTKIRAIISD